MVNLTMWYASLLLLLGGEIASMASTEPLISGDNEIVSFTKDGQKIGSFAISLAGEGGLETAGHDRQAALGSSNSGKSVKSHLLSQQELPLLLADHFARQIPYGKLQSKYLLKPIRELTMANSLLNRGDETLRARRYAYPMSSQSFLRFGRRYKRPRDTKDTGFLRFGRSGGSGRKDEINAPFNEYL